VDNSSPLLFSFSAVIDSNTVDLTSTRLLNFVDIVLGEGFNSAVGAAGMFDNWVDTGGTPSGMEPLMDTLLGLGTEAEIADAINETTPVFQGDMSRAAQDALADTRRIVRIRQDGAQGANSGDDTKNSNFWTKGFGSKAEQDANSGAFGYDADTYGGVIGVDTGIGTSVRIGAAFAYSQTDIDVNTPLFHSGETEAFHGILYGTFIIDEMTDIDWQINYASLSNESQRSMPSWGGLVARGDYDGSSFHIGAHLDRRYELGENSAFTPSIRADYTRVEDDAYTETGAGIYNLNVSDKELDELILGVDGTLAVGLGESALFSATAGVGFDVIDDDEGIAASFVGDPTSTSFVTSGVDASVWLLRGGAGLTLGSDDGIQFSANYDVEVRDEFINNSFSGKIKIPF
jgi:outer membrane autotransporter protein